MYDWEGGQQKKIIKLDHLGNRIMLSDDNKTLYLFIDDHTDRDSNPQIWAYDISNIDSQTGEEYIAETYEYADDISQDTVKISSSKKQSDIVEEDDMMVDFELYDYADTPHHLNEFVGTGKYTILEFSSLACAPCQQIKPILKEFYINHKDQYELITISNDMEEIWKEHKEEKVIWHEWNDHQKARDIIKKYNVMGVPAFFIIDPNGKVLKKCVGIHSFFNSMSLYIPSHKLKKYLMIGSTK
jgi:thioredoxin-related protein